MDSAQRTERRRVFLSGVRDGVPIGLGYLAVASPGTGGRTAPWRFRSALRPGTPG